MRRPYEAVRYVMGTQGRVLTGALVCLFQAKLWPYRHTTLWRRCYTHLMACMFLGRT